MKTEQQRPVNKVPLLTGAIVLVASIAILTIVPIIRRSQNNQKSVKLLSNSDPRQRESGIANLSVTIHPSLTQKLITLLFDEDEYVRINAAIALRRIGSYAVQPLLATLEGNRPVKLFPGYVLKSSRDAVIFTLTNIDPEVTEILAQNITRDHPQSRGVVQETLIRIGKPCLPTIISKLRESQDSTFLILGCNIVAHIGDSGIASLSNLLNSTDENFKLQKQIVQSLGNSNSDSALPTLKQTLGNPRLKGTALSAIGRIGTPKSIDFLAQYSRTVKPSHILAIALGGNNNLKSVSILTRWLDHEEANIVEASALGLSNANNNPALIEKLLFLLKSRHPAADESAYTLGKLRSRKSIPLLLKATNEGEPIQLRINAIIALKNIPAPSTYNDMVKLTEDLSPDVKRFAQEAVQAFVSSGGSRP